MTNGAPRPIMPRPVAPPLRELKEGWNPGLALVEVTRVILFCGVVLLALPWISGLGTRLGPWVETYCKWAYALASGQQP